MDAEDKYRLQLKVLKIINKIDNPSNAIAKFNDMFQN
jgi:hypothetical protein